jgi:hypothetical protein
MTTLRQRTALAGAAGVRSDGPLVNMEGPAHAVPWVARADEARPA